MLIPIIPFSEAALDLSNKQLISDDGSIILEFGENTETASLLKSKITPNLEFGIIRVPDQEFFLDSSDPVSVRIMGSSIVVKSFEPTVLLYAQNTGSGYSISVYTLDGGFKKQTYTASLESITIETSTIVESEEKLDLELMVFQDERTYWRENYDVTLKLFDKKINPNPTFDRSLGAVEGADISVTMTHEITLEVRSFGGQTEKWEQVSQHY